MLRSTDPNFRPVDLEFGPDGALYLVDWFNPLIGHMQHSLRDPNRDVEHGRIWRITYKNRPLVEKPKIAGATVPELLDLLKAYEDRTRYRARRELREHPDAEVLAALDKWVAGLDKNDPDYWHHMLEALWLHQSLDVVDEDLLKTMLTCPEPKARAAATRVLCYWRDRVDEPLELLAQAGQRREPPRPPRGRPRPQLLRRQGRREGPGDRRGVAPDGPGLLPRIHARRDEQDARPADQGGSRRPRPSSTR